MPARFVIPKSDPNAPPFALDTLFDLVQKMEPDADTAMLDTPGLRALTQSLESIAPELTFYGRGRTQRMLIITLIKRLRLARYLATYPEIRKIQLKNPIFLISPPRTGTTFLHRLLSQDPAHRTPRIWEVFQAPPPEPEYRGDPAYFEKDYRVPIAKAFLETRARFSPQMSSIHSTNADDPEECYSLLETSMISHSFMHSALIVDYLSWLDDQPDEIWRQVYALYVDQLRLLHWWWPGERWLLKSPFHLWGLDAIFANFPDAIVVQQYRNAATCMASFCSLTAEAHKPLVASLDYAQIGQISLSYLRKALARNSEQRKHLDPSRFIDIDYRDLVADPMGCVRTIYQAAGIELSPEGETRMQSYLTTQQQDRKKTTHHYSLSDYHLNEKEAAEAFAPYNALNPRQEELDQTASVGNDG